MSLESLVEDQMVDHALSARRETGRCRRVGRLYGSEFWIDTENEIVAVFMSQVYDLPRRDEIVRRFGSEVFRALVTPTSSD